MKKTLLLLAVSVAALSPHHVIAQPKGGGQGPTPVIIARAYEDKFVDRAEAIGTLKANETITLASTVTETVTAVNFEDGQRVKKGDVLVEMTDSEEKALLDQQRAVVREAERQLNRTKDLMKTGAASGSVLDERQRTYSSARAGLAALQSRLQDHIIVAPFDGVVGLRNISVGALLQPGTKITTLDDDSIMKLDFSVPSVFLPTLKTGVDIVARAKGFTQAFNGKISAIDSQVDETSRSVIVRAIIPNEEGVLKPGLLMTVELLRNPRDAVAIPETAIIPEGAKTYVFVVDETASPPTAVKREVTIGTRRVGDVEITENMKAGEAVITQGTMTAKNGGAVSITTEQKRGETMEDIFKRMKDDGNGDQTGKEGK